MLVLARECGLETAESRLETIGHRDILLVKRFDRADAEATIRTMEQTVRDRWYGIARAEGVSENDCGRISRAFAYPGFRLPAGEIPEQAQRLRATAFGQQGVPEVLAVLARHAAVFPEPLHRVGIQHFAPDTGIVACRVSAHDVGEIGQR